MNIFAVDNNPFKAATMLCDEHVIKMPMEAVRILCSVLKSSFNIDDVPYSTNLDGTHGCAVWASESPDNFEWLLNYGFALCEEYKRRYHKLPKARRLLVSVRSIYKNQLWGRLLEFKCLTQTKFYLCMPDNFRKFDAIESYRYYYANTFARILKYTNRMPPIWMLTKSTPFCEDYFESTNTTVWRHPECNTPALEALLCRNAVSVEAQADLN